MRRAPALLRATRVALLLAVAPATYGLASVAPARAAEAITTAEAIASDDQPADEPSGPGWGPILGACIGVLFGGALALWQIRGMKNRR